MWFLRNVDKRNSAALKFNYGMIYVANLNTGPGTLPELSVFEFELQNMNICYKLMYNLIFSAHLCMYLSMLMSTTSVDILTHKMFP